MSLTFHNAVATPQSLANKGAVTAQQTLDNNFTLGKTELQGASDALQDGLSSLHGEGLLTVPTVTSSVSSLAVTFGAFKCLIGEEIAYAGGTFTALASQTGAGIYFQMDGTWANVLPTAKSYALIGTYNSDTDGVTSVTLSGKLLIPKLATVTGTVANIVVPEVAGLVEGYLDHSATTLFAVDGVLTLTLSDTTNFYVQELYAGGMVSTTNDDLTDPPHQRTDGGFWYKICRRSGSYYATAPSVSLTYTRTGFTLAV